MARPKRTRFALLGWVVWKLLAVVGLPIAKRKLEGRRHGRSISRRPRRR